MSINSVQQLDTIAESLRLQKKFNLSQPPDTWLEQFILQVFDLFFLPVVLTVFFLILTASWFESAFIKFVPNDFIRYLCRGLLFLGISYVITRTYIVNVVQIQDGDN